MRRENDAGDSLLEARLRDGLARSGRGEVATLYYLTPREQRRAERFLRSLGEWSNTYRFGGYADAERACLFLLPDYLSAMLESMSDASAAEVEALLQDWIGDAVCAVRILGSGYRVLTHRDYLGSILALGLERDAFGDIAVQDEREAILFCTRRMADFLCENLTHVASDCVKCTPYVLDEQFTDGRKYRAIHDTVASPRLDCVVAALTNLSREAAQSAVREGRVEVEFEPVEEIDFVLSPPVTLSIRGYGRFILRSFDGETRKGRLRMRADQLI